MQVEVRKRVRKNSTIHAPRVCDNCPTQNDSPANRRQCNELRRFHYAKDVNA